jgi:hypothetical protein
MRLLFDPGFEPRPPHPAGSIERGLARIDRQPVRPLGGLTEIVDQPLAQLANGPRQRPLGLAGHPHVRSRRATAGSLVAVGFASRAMVFPLLPELPEYYPKCRARPRREVVDRTGALHGRSRYRATGRRAQAPRHRRSRPRLRRGRPSHRQPPALGPRRAPRHRGRSLTRGPRPIRASCLRASAGITLGGLRRPVDRVEFPPTAHSDQPERRFEIVTWHQARVHQDSHVAFDKRLYSVPRRSSVSSAGPA